MHRAVLDTNVLVAAGFRPGSASGRLAAAVVDGSLVNLWRATTRAEAERLFATIPPLRRQGTAAFFPEAGRYDGLFDPAAYPEVPGRIDRVFAALAGATGAPLVTADGPLAAGARTHGVPVLSPAEAVRLLR